MQSLVIHIQQGEILTAQSIQLKTQWNELTLREFILLSEITDHRSMLAVLSGLDRELFDSVTDSVIAGLVVYVDNIVYHLPKHDVPKFFDFKDNSYVLRSVESDCLGAFEDARAEIGAFKDKPIKAAPLLLAIYCRPCAEVYDYNKALKRAELFNELPADMAYSLAGFFLSRLQRFCQTLKSLVIQKQNLKRKRLIWLRFKYGASTVVWMRCPADAR